MLSTAVSTSSYNCHHLITSPKHIIVDIVRVEFAFVRYGSTYRGGPSAFLADVSQQTYVLKHAFYVLQTLLADGVVVSSYSYLPVYNTGSYFFRFQLMTT